MSFRTEMTRSVLMCIRRACLQFSGKPIGPLSLSRGLEENLFPANCLGHDSHAGISFDKGFPQVCSRSFSAITDTSSSSQHITGLSLSSRLSYSEGHPLPHPLVSPFCKGKHAAVPSIHRQSFFSLAPKIFPFALQNRANEPPADKHATSGPLAVYHREVETGNLAPGDSSQEVAVRALQALYLDLVADSRDGSQASLWTRLTGKRPKAVKGLYLYGGVGTGKTMMMDFFYNELPHGVRKKRLHFHDFMLSVHGRLHKPAVKGLADPLAAVADQLSDESHVLCLDEFMVTDVADAMILNRLFARLFDDGLVLISTSNRPPERLYEGGLQRHLFLPFIDLLRKRCETHDIGAGTDYRKLTALQQGSYFVGQNAETLLREKFQMMTAGTTPAAEGVEVAMGRILQLPMTANGIAFCEFYELCELPLGAADYIALCTHFHTVFLSDVPQFGASSRAAAYRFVTLVDVMYEHKTRFICSAEGTPMCLFERVVTRAEAPKRTSGRGRRGDDADVAVDNELGFAKDRTISRLTEMQSTEYLEDHEENLKNWGKPAT